MDKGYTEAIAKAAKEYRRAKRHHRVMGREATLQAYERAWEKLSWMIDAEENGWDIDDYEPE